MLSSASYATAFRQVKAHKESHHLSFTTGAADPYNLPFCMEELSRALKATFDTSPGPDGIQNKVLRHLPPSTFLFLLNMYN